MHAPLRPRWTSFGHIAHRLVEQHGFRCSYLTEQARGSSGRIERILYKPRYGATQATHVASRGFENFTWRSHAVLDALKQRADIRPDVIVGHSGFGSTLFLRDFYPCPIVNFCEWFYRWDGADSELLRHPGGPSAMNRLTDRCRDAMLLADLDACTLGYSPMNWQRSRIPNEYQYTLETIFDGIDTSFWRPLSWRERIPRRIAGKPLPRRKKVVTYVSRGFESMRGFDVFMRSRSGSVRDGRTSSSCASGPTASSTATTRRISRSNPGDSIGRIPDACPSTGL